MPISIAIVEDDEQARRILCARISQAAGFYVAGDWGDAETALRRLVAIRPNVVLMDINLPNLSGVEAVRRLKPIMPETQFVMLTVYEDANHIYDALTAGATGYLLKQTSRDELLAAVREVHGGGSPITSSIARKVVQFFQQHPVPATLDDPLSARERQVLQLVTQGCPYKEIADTLKISVPTVSTYVRRTYEKLHVCSRAEAVARFTLLTHPEAQAHSV